jgi:CheY-like chemotaxis protein
MHTLRVLVVDDYPAAAEAMALLFDTLGSQTRTAMSGTEAMAALEQYEPDIVMLDIDLGDMSGLDVARWLRARSDRHQPYLVAVSGNNDAGLPARAVDAGFDRFILKPIGVYNLHEIMGRANEKHRGAAAV